MNESSVTTPRARAAAIRSLHRRRSDLQTKQRLSGLTESEKKLLRGTLAAIDRLEMQDEAERKKAGRGQ